MKMIKFEEQLNYINYKKTVKTLHDSGWENGYFTSSGVSLLGYGYIVSRYPQLCEIFRYVSGVTTSILRLF